MQSSLPPPGLLQPTFSQNAGVTTTRARPLIATAELRQKTLDSRHKAPRGGRPPDLEAGLSQIPVSQINVPKNGVNETVQSTLVPPNRGVIGGAQMAENRATGARQIRRRGGATDVGVYPSKHTLLPPPSKKLTR